ncbi:YvcK family protein [Candidatus Woesearchaeota archaeon]|nr:YvcK family protein [Candidatus Woesearchaeota archaeon]
MSSIVVIGGGTGSYTVLRGLKKYTDQLTAIVSMFDSGGSTGKLRDEFGYLPPGDIRRCLIALSPESTDNLFLRRLFEHRFGNGEGLKGHSFGNLFLTALRDITGSDLEAIKQAARILNIKGKVLPVTLNNCTLCAELEDGQIVKGETNIDIPKHNPSLRIKRVFHEPAALAHHECIESIKNAKAIIIGPGDLYTSIVSTLSVEGISEAIQESSAKKIYICNIMTKHGETTGFRVSDHVSIVNEYMPIDYVLCNNKRGNPMLMKKYEEENAFFVEIDYENLKSFNIIERNLITEPILLRHDSVKLAKTVMELL